MKYICSHRGPNHCCQFQKSSDSEVKLLWSKVVKFTHRIKIDYPTMHLSGGREPAPEAPSAEGSVVLPCRRQSRAYLVICYTFSLY